MTTFLNSPRLLEGALVAIDPLRPKPTMIVFQYTPETVTRRLETRGFMESRLGHTDPGDTPPTCRRAED